MLQTAKNYKIVLGSNSLPGVGAPRIFSAPGLAVPETVTVSIV